MSRFVPGLWIAVLLLLATEGASGNVIYRPGLGELVDESPNIFIGTVTSVYRPGGVASIREVAVVNVDFSYKGSTTAGVVRLVSKGFMAELFMACCVVGHRYVFFVKDGYDEMSMDGQQAEVRTVGAGEYVSPTNGRFSSYELDHDRVIGWPFDSGATGGVGLDQVVRQVRSFLGATQ